VKLGGEKKKTGRRVGGKKWGFLWWGKKKTKRWVWEEHWTTVFPRRKGKEEQRLLLGRDPVRKGRKTDHILETFELITRKGGAKLGAKGKTGKDFGKKERGFYISQESFAKSQIVGRGATVQNELKRKTRRGFHTKSPIGREKSKLCKRVLGLKTEVKYRLNGR